MKTGTIETISENEEKRKRLVRLSEGIGTSGGNNGGGGDDGGGGGNSGGDKKPKKQEFEETDHPTGNKARIFTIFLLIAVLMTFGGLIAAYVVVSSNGVLEWKPFAMPLQVWISTAIILASSFAYHVANSAIKQEKQEKAKKWLLITTVFGGIFIASQLVLWFALYRRGYYMQQNPYVGFFYILTAVHAAHVLGGICALGTIVLRSWIPTKSPEELEKRQNLSNVVGWYWHTMDGLWLILVALLGFWK